MDKYPRKIGLEATSLRSTVWSFFIGRLTVHDFVLDQDVSPLYVCSSLF